MEVINELKVTSVTRKRTKNIGKVLHSMFRSFRLLLDAHVLNRKAGLPHPGKYLETFRVFHWDLMDDNLLQCDILLPYC